VPLRIIFEEGRRKYEISYDNRTPDKSFAVTGGKNQALDAKEIR
jgi:hypothetical protein